MDATTERLVDFALRAEFDALTAETVRECKRRLIDTFAGAMGAYNEALSQKARAIARYYSRATGASVWGSALQTAPEAAAFANGVMLRFLDISDTYMGKSRGHPSDVISGIVAVGESVHADGRSVINAITLAYDVYCSFMNAVDINSKGWDQPVYGVLAGVLGAGKLLRLSREQMANAVSLALTPNMALGQTRQGDLSSWKGCAGANAARNAVFAAMLAHEGFTGPTAVFEGKRGLWDIVGRFEWPLPASSGSLHMVTRTHLKSLPICYHGQSAVLGALDMRARLRVQDITEIQVEAYREAVAMMGNDPTRWAPTTRETADHSMPYVIAIALLDGEVTARSFAHERLTDPAVVNLMRKVKVSESAALSAQYPESMPSRLSIRMSSGEVFTAEVRYPKGHAKNPMDDAEVEQKFRSLFREYGDERQCERALQGLWDFDRATDIGNVLKLFLPVIFTK
ncbi:MAG: MmgE/PrpD family protein [Betaproteobacteria bacterium]|nr:MmgE/PrpD family protein [Betaproteobacteria bacterium]